MKVRIDMDDQMLKQLDQMAIKLNSTRLDLFNNAMSLFCWVVSEIEAGRSIASIDEVSKKYKQLDLPIFSQIPKT